MAKLDGMLYVNEIQPYYSNATTAHITKSQIKSQNLKLREERLNDDHEKNRRWESCWEQKNN